MGQVIQDAQLSQRDRAVGWVSYGPKRNLKLELGNNIYGHYKSIFNHSDVISRQIEFGEKMQNKGYNTAQGHSRSSIWVSFESQYETSY